MKQKTGRKLLSFLLTLALVLGLMPGMGLTAYAAPTETLLTTITATAKEQANYSTANVATVSFSYSSGGSSAYLANWGWWGYGWSATVTAAEGYTITKCIFYDDANRTATDSEAPFVVETTEEDKTPRINGTPIDGGNYQSKGIKKIEVYGYATPAHTHNFTYSASGATITATCTAGCPDSYDTTPATLTIAAAGGTYDGTTAYGATVTNNIPAVTGDTVGDVAYYKVDTQGATTGGTVQTGAPTGAGYYYASVTLTSGSNTYTAVKAFTVAKIDPTAPTGLTATYGQKLSDVVLPTGWTWADSTQSVGNVVSPAATFKANFAGDDNYNAASNVDVTVTVSKADATTAMQEASVSIAGTSGKTATVSYALPDGASYGAVTNSNTEFFTVDTTNGLVLTAANNWTASEWATDAPKTFTVAVSGATNYNDYTLTVTVTPTYKATQTITASDVTATYGDTGKKIEASTTGDGGLSYAVKSGDAVTVDASGNLTIVKAGSAVITVTAAETDTYAQATMDVNVTVNTKAMTVSAEDVNVTVDGQAHGITVTVTDPASGATVKYGTEAGSYTLDASPTQTEVGEKTVYYQVTADNYTTTTGSAKVTVSAKSAQTITASDVTATYGDTGKKIEASTSGDGGLSYAVKSGDAVTVDDSGNLTILEAGAAVVTVTAAETATYAQATKDVNVTVNTKAMTVSAADVNVTVDGQPHGISVNVTEPTTGYTVKYGTTEGTYDQTSSPTQTEVGEKTVYYQVTADNYTTYTGSAKVTVSAKAAQTITASDVTATYGDTGKRIEATTTGDGALSYAVKSGDAVTVDDSGNLTILKAGAAVVTVTAAETATYAQATKDVNVTVNTKAMTVSAADVNVTVDGQAHGITVNMTDPASGATVKYGTEAGSYTLDVSPTQTEVGEKTVYYQVTADNYTTYTGSAKVTVNAKQTQTITAEDVTATYGDTDKKVTATTDGIGAISYAVKEGSGDYIEVNASTGALTIKAVPADGKAYVIVTAAETAAYAQATKEVTVTISKANAVAATVTANNRTYDATEKPLVTVTGEPTGGTMQYALGTATEATEQYTTSIPAATDAGTYYVWYKAVGDTNHLDSAAACVTVTVSALTIAPADVPTSEVVEVDGVKYPVDPVTGAIQIPDSSSARIIETFGYSNGGDAHTTYPTSLKVWVVTEDANGERTAVRVPELDDIMRYSGFSIRVTGNRGIRMITSVPTDKKNALIAAAGLAGFTLEEYGTVVGWADALNGGSLTMDNALGHAYAYKRGAGDVVFKTSGGSTQYTNVLVKFTDEQVSKDLIMRSYMVLSKAGVRYTLYGGSVQRSIGYVAYQNRAAFRPGTAPYEYVWSLIHIAYGNRYDGEYQH